MATHISITVPHSLIRAVGVSIGTEGFAEEDAVLRQFSTTCQPAYRKRLLSFSAACRRMHRLCIERRRAA